MFKCPKIKRGFCHTPLDSLDEPLNNTCSPDNPALLEAFRNTRFVFDNTSLDMLDWVSNEPQCSVGIPGISHTSTIMENGGSHYLEQGEVHPGVEGVGLQLSAQVTSSFFILISIFFPSVTGECVSVCGYVLCVQCVCDMCICALTRVCMCVCPMCTVCI